MRSEEAVRGRNYIPAGGSINNNECYSGGSKLPPELFLGIVSGVDNYEKLVDRK